MIKVLVEIRDINRATSIKLDMEEYTKFIEDQASTLGIIKPTETIDSVKGKPFKSISIMCPPNMGRTTSKSFMDEFLNELNKAERRND